MSHASISYEEAYDYVCYSQLGCMDVQLITWASCLTILIASRTNLDMSPMLSCHVQHCMLYTP